MLRILQPERPKGAKNEINSEDPSFLDAIASPSSYPCQSVGEWVIGSFRFGDSYRIFELCELVYKWGLQNNV